MFDKPRQSDIGVNLGRFDKVAGVRPEHPDRKARMGFIGVGWWATTNHMPMLHVRRDVSMASACGLDKDVLRRVRKDFGFEHTTTDVRELLEQDLDGVIVATPHPLHAEHAIAAMDAGCHVMVEKPMTTTIEQARALHAKAKETKRIVTLSYGWHHRPLCVKAKEMIDGGLLGEVEHVVCHMGTPGKNLFGGVSFDYADSAYVVPDLGTYADPGKAQGGFGHGQLSHLAGLLFWLTGLQADEVFAYTSRIGFPLDMYNAISVRFTNGAIGTVAGAATVPGGARYQLDLRILGSDGMMNIDIDRERLDVFRHDGRDQILEVERDAGAYRCDGPPHEFVELILGLTDRNSAPVEVGVKAVELVAGAYESVRTHAPVKVAP